MSALVKTRAGRVAKPSAHVALVDQLPLALVLMRNTGNGAEHRWCVAFVDRNGDIPLGPGQKTLGHGVDMVAALIDSVRVWERLVKCYPALRDVPMGRDR